MCSCVVCTCHPMCTFLCLMICKTAPNTFRSISMNVDRLASCRIWRQGEGASCDRRMFACPDGNGAPGWGECRRLCRWRANASPEPWCPSSFRPTFPPSQISSLPICAHLAHLQSPARNPGCLLLAHNPFRLQLAALPSKRGWQPRDVEVARVHVDTPARMS